MQSPTARAPMSGLNVPIGQALPGSEVAAYKYDPLGQ